MGTPDFSVPVLENLIENKHEVVAVVTQPDKERGRGKSVQFTPVKLCAIMHNIEVYQPKKIKDEEAVNKLKSYDADLFVVVAFGQILSQEILDIPRHCCVNIHASLLPKYRGAAPIQWAVIDGEQYSGVTIMRMDAGLDTGDIMLMESIELDRDETAESLHIRLSDLGARLIIKAINKIEDGSITYRVQNNDESCYAKMLSKSIGHINFAKAAIAIERLVRGLNSWPSAYANIKDKKIKIWKAYVIDDNSTGEVSVIAEITKEAIIVQTGSGKLAITEVQLEGKKRMLVADFLRGYQLKVGDKFE